MADVADPQATRRFARGTGAGRVERDDAELTLRAAAKVGSLAPQAGRGEANFNRARRQLTPLFLDLVERLPQGDIALLLRGPVTAAGDGAINDQIVSIDEARLVASEKHGRMRDVLGQAGAGDRLGALIDLAHHVGG